MRSSLRLYPPQSFSVWFEQGMQATASDLSPISGLTAQCTPGNGVPGASVEVRGLPARLPAAGCSLLRLACTELPRPLQLATRLGWASLWRLRAAWACRCFLGRALRTPRSTSRVV